MKKFLIIIAALFCCFGTLFSEEILFKYQKGIKYKMVTTVFEDVYYNNEYSHSAEILNKIAIETKDVKEGSGFLAAVFQVSEKLVNGGDMYRLNEDFYSEFWRDGQGHYSSSRSFFMPTVRDVPLFPEKPISPGDNWEATGEEVHDFRDYGIAEPQKIPVTVQYVYVKNEKRDGVECAVFKIFYNIVFSRKNTMSLGMAIVPMQISGNSNQTLYFDIKNGRPFYYEEKFDMIYLLLNGEIIRFKGSAHGEVTESEDLDIEDVAKKLEEMIKNENLKDTLVEKEEDGVRIIFEDIHFEAESDILLPEEQNKLKKIAQILNQYPERDLFIGGHTALAGTEEGRQQLSEMRAQAVGEFLLSIGVREEHQMIFKGFGARQPRGDNISIEGRKKNRRVEIKILDN